MPKARVEKIVSDDGQVKVVEVEVGQPDKTTKTARYEIPSNASVFQKMVASLTDVAADGKESDLQRAYRLYVASIDRNERAKMYEQAQQESTFITVGKERVNIMEFPLKRLVKGINGMRSTRDVRLATIPNFDSLSETEKEATEASVDRGIGFGPWATAARKLVEDGKARENDATGILEMVEA